MKLYREVKITSAEQAEALAVGTIALSPANDRGDAQACIRVEGGWHVTREVENNDQDTLDHALMIGDQALVPIEAEEEWTAMGEDYGDPWIAHVGHDGIDGTREEAEAYVRRFGGFLAHRARTRWEDAT